MAKKETQTRLCNLAQLAARYKHLAVPKSWLRDQALSGRIPCMEVHRGTRVLLFDPEAVERSLLERAQLPLLKVYWSNSVADSAPSEQDDCVDDLSGAEPTGSADTDDASEAVPNPAGFALG